MGFDATRLEALADKECWIYLCPFAAVGAQRLDMGAPGRGAYPGWQFGGLHLDGGRTVLEPLGRRDNPPDQRTSPGLPGDRPGAQKRKRGFAGFSAGTTRSLKVAGYTPVALATANGTERNRLVRAPTVSRGFLHFEVSL